MVKLWDTSAACLNQKLLVKVFSLVSIWLSVLERKIKLLNLLLEASHRKNGMVCPVQTVAVNSAPSRAVCIVCTADPISWVVNSPWAALMGHWGLFGALCTHRHVCLTQWGVWPLVLLGQTHQAREAFSQAFGNEWPAMVLKRCGLLLQTNTYELCVFTTGRKL